MRASRLCVQPKYHNEKGLHYGEGGVLQFSRTTSRKCPRIIIVLISKIFMGCTDACMKTVNSNPSYWFIFTYVYYKLPSKLLNLKLLLTGRAYPTRIISLKPGKSSALYDSNYIALKPISVLIIELVSSSKHPFKMLYQCLQVNRYCMKNVTAHRLRFNFSTIPNAFICCQ